MRHISGWVLLVVVAIAPLAAVGDGAQDEAAIRGIIEQQVAAWNAGDGKAYSVTFAKDGGFTNIFGMVMYGHDAFEKRHSEIFATFFKGTTRRGTIHRIRFVTPDVAIVDEDTEVHGIKAMPPGVTLASDGVLRTRLQQVFVKRDGAWWIEAYHNVDLKSAPAAASN